MERCLRLEVFVRSDSTLCQKALKFTEAFTQRHEGICLQVVDTLASSEGLDRYWQLVRQYRVEKPRVPMFHACGRLKIGFSNEAKSTAAIEDLFTIHAYIRPGCQHCRDARRFLVELGRRWTGLRIAVHDLDTEAGASQEMGQLVRQHGMTATSLPVIYVCGRVLSGYRSDASTGRQIEELLLKACVVQPLASNARLPTEHRPRQAADTVAAGLVSDLSWDSRIHLMAATAQAARRDTVPAAIEPRSSEKMNDERLMPPLEEEDESTEEIYTAPVEAPEGIELPWIGYVRVRDLGLPIFTLLIGLIDGFNPCAMWVLVFLLSVLVNVNDRRKIAAIAGTFVIVSGLAYFAFMAAWLNLFMLVGIARPLQVALGVLAVVIGLVNVKDFFAFKRGLTFSIPESTKPGIYSRVRRIVTTDYISVAIGLSIVLAVLVNVVELMCTAGLPAVYTQILTMQQLPAWQNYAYLGLYNVGYMFDDSVLVIAFIVTLSHRKMREAEGRWLKLVSGVVVLALGGAMLFWPDWLQW